MPSFVLVEDHESESAEVGGDVDPACRQAVRRDVRRVLRHHATAAQYRRYSNRTAPAEQRVVEDLVALSHQDPAAGHSWEYVADTYASYQAVLAYRLANSLLRATDTRSGDPDSAALARMISEDAKVLTGIEIHPAAEIGRRFVLDHAAGTVIGETAILGDDCYVLQGVILGASGIAANPAGKRHPTLGDRVQVGAFARLLGPITVGNDTRIGPHAVVVTDVPAGSHLRLFNQCQVRSPRTTMEVFGVVPLGAGWLEIHGDGVADADVRIVDSSDREYGEFPTRIVERTPTRLTCRLDKEAIVPADAVLRLAEPNGERVLITQLGAVWRAMMNADLRPMSR